MLAKFSLISLLAALCLGLSAFSAAAATAPATEEMYATARDVQQKPALVMVGTVDEEGFPQIRAMSNLRQPSRAAAKLTADGAFTAYAVTRADSEKMAHLAKNPKMSMYYLDDRQALLLVGTCEVVTDAAIRGAVWEDSFRQLGYGAGPEDAMLAVLRFTPTHGKFYRMGRQYRLTLPHPAP